MNYRVVIPRSVPFDDSNRVQQAVWKRGYGTRLAGRGEGRVTIEFLKLLEALPEPADVGGLEEDLDSVLSGKRVHAAFTGHGAWLETVQRPARKRAS